MTESCLSPKVKYILCDVYKQTDHYCPEALDKSGLLQWNTIQDILPSAIAPEDADVEYFVSCVKALSPVLRTLHQHYTAVKEDTLCDGLKQYLLWTSEPEVLMQCIYLARNDSRVGTIQALLMCTAIVERSLGDLYLMKGKQCPSMLKDLLVTKELQQLLGSLPLQVLRIMMGPPVSLNLRNVLWHGFPAPDEIHPQYFYMLISVVASMGKMLQDSLGSTSQIKHRAMVTFPQVTVMEQTLLEDYKIGASEIAGLVQILEDATFVQKSMIDIWVHALAMYERDRFGDCVCLLLPQLEHGLRRMFTVVNNCPQRMLTAESSVLFTTLDEILSPCLEDGTENKLRYFLGDKVMMMLLDLFSYPAGPRLRDRVSHGEASIMSLSSDVAQLLVFVCMVCIQRCQLAEHTGIIMEGNTSTDELNCSLWIEKAKDVVTASFMERFMLSVEKYRCHFHPIAIIQSKVIECAEKLEKWNVLSVQIQSFVKDSLDQGQESDIIKNIFDAGQMWLTKYSKHIEPQLDLCILEPFHNLLTDYQSCVKCVISTVYRTVQDKQKNKENEIVGLLHHITQRTSLAAEQIHNVGNEWSTQYENKELRSRQRRTYLRVLQSIPVLSSGLRLVLLVSVVTLYALDHVKLQEYVEQVQIVKLLKFMLKYVELLTSYTASNQNRWKEAAELTVQLAAKVSTAS